MIAACQQCRNSKANPERPTLGPLHESRTAFDEKPFTFVGADCFGPLAVREKRSEVKRWGVIFTCLTFRAAHLELVQDLSADQMVSAVRRLIARRGPIKVIYSDNGTNFIGAERATREELKTNQERMTEAVGKRLELKWCFIPAYSPWTGGAWERLIGYAKKCLKFTLKGEVPTENALINLIIEAEVMLNKRPLTHTPVDPDDEEPLTPNLALYGVTDLNQAEYPIQDANRFAKLGRRRVAHLVEKFRRRWEREYLPALSQRGTETRRQNQVEVGDVVKVAENEANRDRWKLARITRVHPTSDGVARVVDVKMGNGEIRHKRAVGNMALLHLKEE